MGQGQGKTGREGIELVRDRLSDSDLTSANAGSGSAPSGCSSVTWETGIKHEKSSSSWLKKAFLFFCTEDWEGQF